jgi:hypothetical protein
MKTITMKIKKITLMDFTSWNEQPWDYTCANGVIPSFDLWVTNFVIRCHHEKWHMWSIKVIHVTIKNTKLAHVILEKKKPWKL